MSLMDKAKKRAQFEAPAEVPAAVRGEREYQRAMSEYDSLVRMSGGATGNGTALESNQRAALEKAERARRRRK